MMLKHTFTMAVKWGLLPSNPLRDVRLPVKVNNARLRYLMPEEIDRLLAVSPIHLKRLVLTALHAGMRKSEILPLRWEQVNLEQRFVLLLDTKNGESRGVPLTKTITGVLRELQAEQERFGLSSPFVFPNPLTGKPYRHDIKTSWYTALRKANITDFHFHDLRHTCASYLRMQGVDLLTIAEILGHKDLKMTKRYAHVALTHRLAAIEKLELAYKTDRKE
jgi:integrase